MRFENHHEQIVCQPNGLDLIDQNRNRSDSIQSSSSQSPMANDDMYQHDRDNPFPPEVRQQHSQELTSHLPLRIAIRDQQLALQQERLKNFQFRAKISAGVRLLF